MAEPDPPAFRLLIEGVQHWPTGGYRVTTVHATSHTLRMTRADNPTVVVSLDASVVTHIHGQPIPMAAGLVGEVTLTGL